LREAALGSDSGTPPLWAGDVTAFEALYDSHHRLVFGIAHRISQNQRTAEDVTQVVFLKLWRARGLFSDGNLAGWLARVTRNYTLDVLRRRHLSDVSLSDEDITATRNTCDPFEAVCLRHAVFEALEQLPREQCEVLELGFFGGLTHVEISRQTGVPLGTVKTRIRCGLQRLGALIAGDL
jgi:RNA polymerase sigma-70 factor (ECF subfamily)